MSVARPTLRSFCFLLLAIASALLALLATARPAAAGVIERQAARNERFAEELRALNPEAVGPFVEANGLSGTNEARALELYERVNTLAPEFTPAMRRRAVILAFSGKRAEALALVRRARALEGSPENALALALVLVTPPPSGEPTAADTREALGIVRRGVQERPTDVDDHHALCQVALYAQSVPDLEAGLAALLRLAPTEPETYVWATVVAGMRGDRDAAYASIATARRLGLEVATADRLTKMIDDSEPPLFRWGKRVLAVFVLWLAGLGLLFGVGGALSAATLRFVRRLSPDASSSRGGGALRGVYRAVLHVASVYYYLSLPLVLLLSVLLGLGLILAFYWIGRIPIYFVLIIVSVVLFTIVSVVKSLLVRARDEDPGVGVDLVKHPGLARVVREVAARVGTRSVDAVYLTTHTEVAVLERGGMLRQLRGTSTRCLVLGVGVLDGMKLGPFKAILAHEYGHFSNRDTAGGGVALSVRRSLFLTALGLAQRGAAAWYNPAWLFVVNFQRIFLRISQGASRLQEVMADRIAAFAYGPEAFARGLTHVVRRTIEFDVHVNATLEEVVGKARPLANLYRYEPEAKPGDDVEEAVTRAMAEEPSPYDSHPKPNDRVAWVRELATSIAPAGDDDEDVWTLFASRDEIEEVMTDEVRARLAVQGVLVPAGDAAAA
ncbi:MAG: M48 family metalloprotease [Labilithrix sp.]|nr:M48 family metalloprotease [Labilithrix sp.]